MNPFKTAAIAFSTYSVIPMPRFEWSGENMRYALCFLPLVGIVIGALLYAWSALCNALGFSRLLYAAVGVFLPIAVTGGIHMDGFCDVCDALASHKSKEQKLSILKDSHIGAFAAIKCCVYFILQLALLYECKADCLLVCIGFVLSRALSALLATLLPNARGSGMLADYTSGMNKAPAAAAMLIAAALCSAGMVFISPIGGVCCIVLCAAWCFIYKAQSSRQFGGVTGDPAGYFLQICEILVLVGTVIGNSAKGLT